MSMPAPPPDTRAAGQSGHITDHNTISDAITALESAVGGLQQAQATVGTVQVLGAGGTITVPPGPAPAILPVSEAANVAGIILGLPPLGGTQQVTVVNRSAFTITFAVPGTSNVADGTSDIIPALAARSFTYDSGAGLWYRSA